MESKKLEQAYNFDLSVEEIDNLNALQIDKIKVYQGTRTLSNNLFEPEYSNILNVKNQEFKDLIRDQPNAKRSYALPFVVFMIVAISAFCYFKYVQNSPRTTIESETVLIADNLVNFDFLNRIERGEQTIELNLRDFLTVGNYGEILNAIKDVNIDPDNTNLIRAYCYMKLGADSKVNHHLDLIDPNNIVQGDLYLWMTMWNQVVNNHDKSQIQITLDDIISKDYPSSRKAVNIKNNLDY